MKRSVFVVLSLCVLLCALAVSCGTATKTRLRAIRKNDVAAEIDLPESIKNPSLDSLIAGLNDVRNDTITVNMDGKDMIFMRAVAVGEDEILAANALQAAVVTARFRNVAERHGKVDIAFDVRVPKEMVDSKWQIRMQPYMDILGEEARLQPIYITGRAYRHAQLRGYQRYEKFIDSIITDTTKMIDLFQLEMFLKRNLPQIYALKHDYNVISDDEFLSLYGVTEREAVEHYTNRFVVWRNNRRRKRVPKMYRKYIKAPLVSDGIRLDTVYAEGSDFVYKYVQPVAVRKGLRKVDVSMDGSIYDQDVNVYYMPRTDSLTYYISSVSTLFENIVRYKTMVVERRVDADMTYFVDFERGKAEVRPDLYDNASEIARIKSTISSLLENEVFDLDSISVSAYASPEGAASFNENLSRRRGEAVGRYFDAYVRRVRDSVLAGGYSMDEAGKVARKSVPSIAFRSAVGGEDWERFTRIIHDDRSAEVSDSWVAFYDNSLKEANLDAREAVLKTNDSFYSYAFENIYPRLRSVKFDFHMHRKGMVKDTVHTTIPDEVYARGVQALRDRDYDAAAALLRPYGDYNCALAYVALDRNQSALSILEGLERTPKVEYLLALVYSRLGRSQEAVQLYMDACSIDKTFISRGNLDPEISSLIKAYRINDDRTGAVAAVDGDAAI